MELEDEPYIDDQVQIGEIWNIVQALLKRGDFDKEPWEVKERILKEIYDNNFYDYYGIYDPMKDLRMQSVQRGKKTSNVRRL